MKRFALIFGIRARLQILKGISRAFLLLVLCPFLVSCDQRGTVSSEKVVVRTMSPRWRSASVDREFPFTSLPYFQSSLAFRVSGHVFFSFQPGDYFSKGDTVAYLDQRDFRIACQKAESVWRQKKSEYERAKALDEKGSISRSAYDLALSDYQVSEAAYERAKADLQDTYLLAPFDGYVHEVLVQPYQEVSAGQGILVLVETDRLLLDAYLPEDLAGKMMKDRGKVMAEIRFDAFPEKVFFSDQLNLNPALVSRNLSYQLRVEIENRDAGLLPGMSGSLRLMDSTVAVRVGVLPLKALREDQDGNPCVWVLEPDSVDKVYRRRIGKYRIAGDSLWVESGLEQGEQVVIDGINSLSSGMEVESVGSF